MPLMTLLSCHEGPGLVGGVREQAPSDHAYISQAAAPRSQQAGVVVWPEYRKDAGNVADMLGPFTSVAENDVQVIPALKSAEAHRLVLGDHSKVQISS